MLVDVFAPHFFVPIDAAVLAAMRTTQTRLSAALGGARMTMWRGHVGVNLSHALGLVFVGAFQLRLRRIDQRWLARSPLLGLAIAVAFGEALLAAMFWFWVPCAGFVIATIGLVWTRSALRNVENPRVEAAPPFVRWLAIGGCALGVAGALNFLGASVDVFADGPFSPTDVAVRRAMEATDFALPAAFGLSVSTWRAYVGFHLSHGFVVSGFALAAWLSVRRLGSVVARDRPLQLIFAGCSALWVAIAATCWFWAPLAVTVVATFCLLRVVVGRDHQRAT
jgi:hypothetical protein